MLAALQFKGKFQNRFNDFDIASVFRLCLSPLHSTELRQNQAELSRNLAASFSLDPVYHCIVIATELYFWN